MQPSTISRPYTTMISVAGSIGSLNILISGICFFLAYVHLQRIHGGDLNEYGRIHSWGMVFFCGLGFGPQRLWWGVNRTLESSGHKFLETQVYSALSWITIPALTAVVIGAILLMAPVLGTIHGQGWFQRHLSTLAALWLVLALVIS